MEYFLIYSIFSNIKWNILQKDKGKVNDTEDTKEEAEMYGEDFKIYGKLEQCRIMTSVSAPVYSSKIKKDFAVNIFL